MRRKNVSDEVQERASKSYTERQRELYDTRDLGSIMSRFYDAVEGGR